MRQKESSPQRTRTSTSSSENEIGGNSKRSRKRGRIFSRDHQQGIDFAHCRVLLFLGGFCFGWCSEHLVCGLCGQGFFEPSIELYQIGTSQYCVFLRLLDFDFSQGE